MTPNGNDCQKIDHEFTLEQVTDEFDVDPGIDIVDGSLTANALAQPASADEQQRGRPLPTCRSMYTCPAPDGSTQLPSEANRRSLEGVEGIAGRLESAWHRHCPFPVLGQLGETLGFGSPLPALRHLRR